MPSDTFIGMLTGLGEAHRERQKNIFDQEVARRTKYEDILKQAASNPAFRPEAQDNITRLYATLVQTPYEKKLPKDFDSQVLNALTSVQGSYNLAQGGPPLDVTPPKGLPLPVRQPEPAPKQSPLEPSNRTISADEKILSDSAKVQESHDLAPFPRQPVTIEEPPPFQWKLPARLSPQEVAAQKIGDAVQTLQALGPIQTRQALELKRGEASIAKEFRPEKFAVNPVTGELYDTETGKSIASSSFDLDRTIKAVTANPLLLQSLPAPLRTQIINKLPPDFQVEKNPEVDAFIKNRARNPELQKYSPDALGYKDYSFDQHMEKQAKLAEAASIRAESRAEARDRARRKQQLESVPEQVKTQVNAAYTTKDMIRVVRTLISKKPYLAGPAAGRLEEASQGIGATFGFQNKGDERDAATLAGHLAYLFANELRAAFPNRPNREVIAELKKASARIIQDPNMIEGMLISAENNANIAIEGGKRWGLDLTPSSPPTTGAVRMQAPDGTIRSVPADQVEHFKALGAKVVP